MLTPNLGSAVYDIYIYIIYYIIIYIYTSPRMRRYFAKHTKAGEPVATKEAMKLWKTDEGRAWDHSKPSNIFLTLDIKKVVSTVFYRHD